MASHRRVGARTMVQHVNADRLVDPELPGVLYHVFFSFEPGGPALTSLVQLLAIQSLSSRALTAEDLLGLVYVTAFGMLPGVVFAKTTSLLRPFFFHATNNCSL